MKKTFFENNMSSYKRKKEAFETVESTLDEIQALMNEGCVLIVEGQKDITALETLGLQGDIRKCANVPLAVFCETVAGKKKKIIILTDWDKAGRIRAGRMADYFESIGAECDMLVRKRLIKALKKDISDVESLNTYIRRLRCELDIKNGSE